MATRATARAAGATADVFLGPAEPEVLGSPEAVLGVGSGAARGVWGLASAAIASRS
jgi:hypothetical protein